eukprot:TRINITY_DN24130_c0_g1_i2.p2 TRINITY_DN24130_c0_g1~~TRINITY_DN24130_c0_g1_i2.p2  ORF type:complete len:102 (+),score=8.60 TRINITY_DN24130_c0_g1_i2:326-631(+)
MLRIFLENCTLTLSTTVGMGVGDYETFAASRRDCTCSVSQITWWTRSLPAEDEAIQDILVSMGADVRHGAAPRFGMERDVADALAECLKIDQSAPASSWDL